MANDYEGWKTKTTKKNTILTDGSPDGAHFTFPHSNPYDGAHATFPKLGNAHTPIDGTGLLGRVKVSEIVDSSGVERSIQLEEARVRINDTVARLNREYHELCEKSSAVHYQIIEAMSNQQPRQDLWNEYAKLNIDSTKKLKELLKVERQIKSQDRERVEARASQEREFNSGNPVQQVNYENPAGVPGEMQARREEIYQEFMPPQRRTGTTNFLAELTTRKEAKDFTETFSRDYLRSEAERNITLGIGTFQDYFNAGRIFDYLKVMREKEEKQRVTYVSTSPPFLSDVETIRRDIGKKQDDAREFANSRINIGCGTKKDYETVGRPWEYEAKQREEKARKQEEYKKAVDKRLREARTPGEYRTIKYMAKHLSPVSLKKSSKNFVDETEWQNLTIDERARVSAAYHDFYGAYQGTKEWKNQSDSWLAESRAKIEKDDAERADIARVELERLREMNEIIHKSVARIDYSTIADEILAADRHIIKATPAPTIGELLTQGTRAALRNRY